MRLGVGGTRAGCRGQPRWVTSPRLPGSGATCTRTGKERQKEKRPWRSLKIDCVRSVVFQRENSRVRLGRPMLARPRAPEASSYGTAGLCMRGLFSSPRKGVLGKTDLLRVRHKRNLGPQVPGHLEGPCPPKGTLPGDRKDSRMAERTIIPIIH